ncbi:MAG: tRNA-(ms[2]io[6]A)-hydroxylase [Bradymonadia bacterium]
MLRLRAETDDRWLPMVLEDFDAFLQSHAHNERKVATSAITLASQNPQHVELVDAMAALAQEELSHFHQVFKLIIARGGQLGFDRPDVYMRQMFSHVRKKHTRTFLLDRLVLFGIIEARGLERFTLVAEGLPEGDMRAFYQELVRCEARHWSTHHRLARLYFEEDEVKARLDEMLDLEAQSFSDLPLAPVLYGA